MSEIFSKEELIGKLKSICSQGWLKSVKKPSNAGAVGNTLEKILGIKENNLPIPNAAEWELKAQRKNTTSLTTLRHIESSPKAVKFVSSILLPKYGWAHKTIPKEMSFRSTTAGDRYTDRGFKIVVDRKQQKVLFDFNYQKVDKERHSEWLKSVVKRVGLGQIDPQPYWGFNDLKYLIGSKLKNTFYLIADSKKEGGKEWFKYEQILMLRDFDFDKFLTCLEQGIILIDFDARTHHNHGTKFRIKQDNWPALYVRCEKIL
ncbi:MAG: MvaI/BcnI restriction endonuclease family protein [Planctomycetes bacterium]|nr:MvaI/BcnI restriction endonuclease family protein [Planctomycetota bacterium]